MLAVKAYVSSTFEDLRDCRAEVRLALSRLGVTDVAMEYYVAEPERPLERCLRDIAECDLYIGLFAWRYGYIPPGEDRSITELEYRTAAAAGKPALIFILREEASWPRTQMDRDPTRIETLREELGRDRLCSFFSTPQELAGLVSAAVHNQFLAPDRPLPEGGLLNPESVRVYCQRIAEQYGRLDLEALTPPQYEDQLRIQLNSVFVEPDVREDLPVMDLPKHLQTWLATQENLDDSDLPGGLSAEKLDRLRNAYQQRPRRRTFDLLGAPGTGQKVVLLGDPGAGKSTLARYVALSLADPSVLPGRTPYTGCLPVLIELKSYEAARTEQGCTTFLEFCGLLSRSEGLSLDPAPLHNYLSEDGRAVVIFDGLDEIFDPAHRAAVTRQIAAFAAKYLKVSIVVTSRIIGYSKNTLADAGFTHATLQDLDIEQISDFLTGWYALALPDRPADAAFRKDRLLAAIADSRSIGEMAGNPLLLTILAIIGRHQELPRERWKVYDYAATVLVERWDVNRHLRDERLPVGFIGEDDKKEMLRRIAFLMQAGTGHGGNYLTAEELRREFKEYMQTQFRKDPGDAAVIARAMIGQFQERNFILSHYGGELYGFVHRAFLEYFCAEAFRWQFERDQVIDLDYLKSEVFGRHWDDPAWREVLRLIAGTIREQWMAQIVVFLVDEVNLPWPWQFDDRAPWNIALAAQCLAEGRTITGLEHAATRVLVRVIQLLEHGILGEDYRSTELLRSEILPAISSVGPSWPDREIYRQWYLTRGIQLGQMPISELAALIAAYLFPRDPVFLRAVLSSIRTIGDSHRQPVLAALGEYDLTDPEVRKLFLDLVASDPSDGVRGAAVQALGQAAAEDPQVRALLLDRAASDTSGDIRRAAVQELGRTAEDPQVRALLLDRAASDTSDGVRRAAVQELGQAAAEDPQVRALLLDRAASDTSDGVRRAAVQALGQAAAEDPQVRALLLDRASDPSDDLCRAAVQALGQAAAEDPQVRALLLDRASDPSDGVRRAAVQALGLTVEDPQVRALLLDRAGDPSDGVRRVAVQALGLTVENPQVRSLLLNRDFGFSFDMFWLAQSMLGQAVEDPQVRALLLDRAASDTSADIRGAAVLGAEPNGGRSAGPRPAARPCRQRHQRWRTPGRGAGAGPSGGRSAGPRPAARPCQRHQR